MSKKNFSKIGKSSSNDDKGVFQSLIRGNAKPANITDGLELVILNPDDCYSVKQVRFVFKEIESLSQSMELVGQKEAIRVYPRDKRGHRIDVGERRWRACLLSKRPIVALIDHNLVPVDDEEINKLAEALNSQVTEEVENARLILKTEAKKKLGQIAENDGRAALTPYELGFSLVDLKQRFRMKTQEIAEALGRSPAYISKHLKLVEMPHSVKALMDDEIVTYVEVLNILTNIFEISPERGEQFVDDIRVKGEVTRAEAQEVLNSLKGKTPKSPAGLEAGNGDSNGPSDNSPKQQLASESGSVNDNDNAVGGDESENAQPATPAIEPGSTDDSGNSDSSEEADISPQSAPALETEHADNGILVDGNEVHENSPVAVPSTSKHVLPIVVMVDNIEHRLLDKPSIIENGVVQIFCQDESGYEIQVAASDCKIIRVELTE